MRTEELAEAIAAGRLGQSSCLVEGMRASVFVIRQSRREEERVHLVSSSPLSAGFSILVVTAGSGTLTWKASELEISRGPHGAHPICGRRLRAEGLPRSRPLLATRPRCAGPKAPSSGL
jgi:hypothetical protein